MPNDAAQPYQRVVRISDASWEGVEDFEDACFRLMLAAPQTREAHDAYAALKMRKVELAHRIGEIERLARLPQQSRVVGSPDPFPPMRRVCRPAELDDPERRLPYRPG